MSAGLIKLKNKSSEIIGSETDFKTDLADGDLIVTVVGGVTYTLPVKTVTDATHLTLVRDYDGPDQTGAAWTAMPRETVNRITGQMAADASYLVRSRVLEVNNWYQLLEVNGDVAIKMADGSTYTGPSWLKICDLVNASDLSKIQPLADQIHTDATQVAADKAAADNSAKAAASSASGAASSASAAKSSADTAGSSATAAAKGASDAASSATAAKGSADTAGSSATAAAKSAGDAASSAAAAKGSADSAGGSVTAAAKSASDAANSATASKGSADAAGTSATAAAKSATDASGSASAAKGSADSAGTSATAAASSATSAKSSADNATTSATEASESADRAEAAARNAAAGTVKSVNGITPNETGDVKLGTAADADVTTSHTDATAGRAMLTGDGGLLGTVIRLKNTDLLNKDGCPSSLFGQGGAKGMDDHFDSYGVGAHLQYGLNGDGSRMLGANLFIDPAGNLTVEWLEVVKADGSVAVQKKQKLFGPLNPPTAAQTGALPLTGGTMTGPVTFTINGECIRLKNDSATMAAYLGWYDNNGTRLGYFGRSGAGTGMSWTNQAAGSLINLPADGSVTINTKGNAGNITLNGSVIIGGTKKFAINPAGNSTLNAHLNLWGNTDRPTVVEIGDDTSFHFYSQRNKDGSISLKSAGTVEPSIWTNFDNRYAAKGSTPDLSAYMTTSAANAKFVTGTRQSADVSLTTNANATTVTPAGASMSGITLSTSTITGGIHVLSMRHRTTQYCINGTWVNSGKVSIVAPVMAAREPKQKEKITRISNLSPYTPGEGTEFIRHDGQELSIERLISDEGYDWYQVQSLIAGNHFIAFDDDGIVRQISQDVSYLTPNNLSVAGLLSIPEDCDIDGSWKYDGITVQQDATIVAARALEYNEGTRNKYIQQAVIAISVIQAGIACNRSQDGGSDALSAWQNYLCDLRDMTQEELQQVDVVFPVAPGITF